MTAPDHVTRNMKNKYVTAIEYARREGIKPNDFVEFIKGVGGLNKCGDLWRKKHGRSAHWKTAAQEESEAMTAAGLVTFVLSGITVSNAPLRGPRFACLSNLRKAPTVSGNGLTLTVITPLKTAPVIDRPVPCTFFTLPTGISQPELGFEDGLFGDCRPLVHAPDL